MWRRPEFRAWQGLQQRCLNENDKSFDDYGGRGIKVSERWLGRDGFANFFADLGPRPSAEHQLDREDNEGDYTPTNCRWATVAEQAQNRRSSKLNDVAVSIIRHLRRRGVRQTDIAWAFGMTRNYVWEIFNRRRRTA